MTKFDPSPYRLQGSTSRSAKSDRRAEILDVAAKVLASDGLQAPLRDIADACGILPGSLYHHFESREAVLVELVARFRADVEVCARQALEQDPSLAAAGAHRMIIELAQGLAACALRHRAAVLLTFHEPPITATPELIREARDAVAAANHAMMTMLESVKVREAIRPQVGLTLLAQRLCQSMLHHGVGEPYRGPGWRAIPELRCRILLDGLATALPDNESLDRSPALQAVTELTTTDISQRSHKHTTACNQARV